MNFTQMLAMEVTPLYDPPAKSGKVISSGNYKRREESRKRLESVLPRGTWMAGAEIARKLLTSTDSMNKTLQGFRARGEMESRVIEGTKRNLEWRWK